MNIGVALAVMALGAILSFAVHGSPHGLDLHVVGFILMAVGAAGLYFRLNGFGPLRRVVVLPRRREITTTTTTTRGPAVPYPSAVTPADNGGLYVRPDMADQPAVYTEQRIPSPDHPGEYVSNEPLSQGF